METSTRQLGTENVCCLLSGPSPANPSDERIRSISLASTFSEVKLSTFWERTFTRPAGNFTDKLTAARLGIHGIFAIGATFEAPRRFRVHSQLACGSSDGIGVEVSAFNQHVHCVLGNF